MRKDGFNTDDLTAKDDKTEILYYKQDVTIYQVQYDDIRAWKLYQCSAHYNDDDVIFSSTARMSVKLSSDITFTGTKRTSRTEVKNYDLSGNRKQDDNIVTMLPCYTDVENYLSSDKPFAIRWYKDSDSLRVEAMYDNMWTFYKSETNTNNKITFDFNSYKLQGKGYTTTVKDYDLVIFAIKSSQNGTYRCKAVSFDTPPKVVTLSEVTVTLDSVNPRKRKNLKTLDFVMGYKLLSTNVVAHLKDRVFITCGGFCWRYKWERSYDGGGKWSPLSNRTTSVITVALFRLDEVIYRCTMDVSCLTAAGVQRFKTITIARPKVKPEDYAKVKFAETLPQNIWYDTQSGNKSSSDKVSCQGQLLGSEGSLISRFYRNGVVLDGNLLTVDETTPSGVYQCATYDESKYFWIQQTTEVAIYRYYVQASTTSIEVDKPVIDVGSSFILTCTVEGYPPPDEPTLTHGQTSIPFTTCDSGSNTKVCWRVANSGWYSDTGDYSCTTKNIINDTDRVSYDNITISAAVKVTVNVSTPHSRGYFVVGDKIIVSCIAYGFPLPHYLKLSKGNEKIFVKYNKTTSITGFVKSGYYISYSYEISAAELDDIGTYNCEAESKLEETVFHSKGETTLTVYEPVAVTIDGVELYPKKGSIFTITCVARGHNLPTNVRLYHDDDYIELSGSSCARTQNTVTCYRNIRPVGYSHNGVYKCYAENTVDGTLKSDYSDNKTIEVVFEASVNLNDEGDKEVELGSKYTITCKVEGGRAPHRVEIHKPDNTKLTWEKSSKSNNLACTPENNLDNIIKCKLEVDTTGYNGEGNYRCVGFNRPPGGYNVYRDKNVNIIVIKAVTATISASSTEVDLHSAVTITCTAEGKKLPHYLHLYTTARTLVKYTGKDNRDVTVSEHEVKAVKEISKVEFADNGTYRCFCKNIAKENIERYDVKKLALKVVKDVSIEPINDVEVDINDDLEIPAFTVIGGNPPHEVVLTKPDGEKSTIYSESVTSNCAGTFAKSCSIKLGKSRKKHYGSYIVTANNYAKGGKLKTAEESFNVTVYYNVNTRIVISERDGTLLITDNSKVTIPYATNPIIQCVVDGGKSPHEVRLTLNKNSPLVYQRDDVTNSTLDCEGDHELTCSRSFRTDYTSDGYYTCKGSNRVREDELKQSTQSVYITVFREVIISDLKVDKKIILPNESAIVTCMIEGKPIIDKNQVTWHHENSDIDLAANITTTKGSDDFSLISVLNLKNPSTNFSGKFTCMANGTAERSVNIAIEGSYCLDEPRIQQLADETIVKDREVDLVCEGSGFPGLRAEIRVYSQKDEELSVYSSQEHNSKIKNFTFTHRIDCKDSRIVCTVSTDKAKPIEKEILLPKITGCSAKIPIISGAAGGCLLIVIVAVIVLVIFLRKRQIDKVTGGSVMYHTSREQEDIQFPNPMFRGNQKLARNTEDDNYSAPQLQDNSKNTTGDDETYVKFQDAKPAQQPLEGLYAENRCIPDQEKDIDSKLNDFNSKKSKVETSQDETYSTLGDFVAATAVDTGEDDTYSQLVKNNKNNGANKKKYKSKKLISEEDKIKLYTLNITIPPEDEDEDLYSDILTNTRSKIAEVDEDEETAIYANAGNITVNSEEENYAKVEYFPKNKSRVPKSNRSILPEKEETIYSTIVGSKEDDYTAVECLNKNRARVPVSKKDSLPKKEETVYSTIVDFKEQK